jgi:hypothetical protein
MNSEQVDAAIQKCVENPKCEELKIETWNRVNCEELKKKFPNAIVRCVSEWDGYNKYNNFHKFEPIYGYKTDLEFKSRSK